MNVAATRYLFRSLVRTATLILTACLGVGIAGCEFDHPIKGISSEWVMVRGPRNKDVLAPSDLQWRPGVLEFADHNGLSILEMQCSASGRTLAARDKDRNICVFDTTPRMIGKLPLEEAYIWFVTDAGILISTDGRAQYHDSSPKVRYGNADVDTEALPQEIRLATFADNNLQANIRPIAAGILVGVGDTCIALADSGSLQIIDLTNPSSEKNCRVESPDTRPPQETIFGDHDRTFAMYYGRKGVFLKRQGVSRLDPVISKDSWQSLLALHDDVLTLRHDDTIHQYRINALEMGPHDWHEKEHGPFSASPDGRLALSWKPVWMTATPYAYGFESTLWGEAKGWCPGSMYYFPRALFEEEK